MTGDLKGRVCFVTGASRNIGRAIAVAMAERGADVVIHVARDAAAGAESVAAVKAAGARAALVSGDLGDPETAKRVVTEAAACLWAVGYRCQQCRDPARRRLRRNHV